MRNRKLLNVLLATALSLLLVIPASASAPSAGPQEPVSPPPWELDGTNDVSWASDLWFVEFHEPPASRGGSPSAHANERAELIAETRQEGIDIAEQRNFTTLWNGLSVRVDREDVNLLRGLDSVSAVYPVALIELPEPAGAAPDLVNALAMTGSDNAHDLKYSGTGVSVAIIDTGIDYNHPDLGGDGALGNVILADSQTRSFDHPRISHGWDYVGDDFDASIPDATPDPNPDPMDPHGHGTHVAGISGASAADPDSGVTGVAPEITLGAYKVFGTEGPTTADVIIEALEDSYVDGMDVVNMSLGATLAWGQEYPTTATSNELAAQGVVVVNSAGNDGDLGTYSLSAPANAHDIISVASADNTFFDAFVFEVEQLDREIPYMELDGAELPPTEGESNPLALPSVSTIEGQTGNFGCDVADFDAFPGDHVALVERGHCTFATKYLNAASAEASGVVIFNNVAGMFAGTILDDGIEGIWGAGINRLDGLDLRDLIEDGEDVTLTFTDQTQTLPNPTGGLVSSFSSYGQDVELAFGPSILAPGGLINSTWPGNGYSTISGTSMSAPHVAGAVALLLEAEPGLDPFNVRDRLQNTAEPVNWSLNPGLGLPDHTFRQGAGMLQIDRTVTAEQHASPGQVTLGDGIDPVSFALTVTNTGSEVVTYSIGHVDGLQTAGSTFNPGFFLAPAGFDAPQSVSVAAGGSEEIDVTVTPPNAGLWNHQYGGYLVLTPVDGSPGASTLRIPYVGYAGDYLDHPLLGFGSNAAGDVVDRPPRLSEIVYDADGEIEGFEPVEPGNVFTVRDGDIPVVETFFGHFPREMRLYAVDGERTREYLVFADQYLPRSLSPDFFWPFGWAGTIQSGASANWRSVPSGTYTLRVEVLRTMGNPENPEHWETWDSAEFQLDTRGGGPPVVPGPGQGHGRGR